MKLPHILSFAFMFIVFIRHHCSVLGGGYYNKNTKQRDFYYLIFTTTF